MRACLNRLTTPLAWAGMFSIAATGCYTSSVIEPRREDANIALWKMARHNIMYVVTKDSTEYRFDKPPAVDAESIVGEAKIRVTEGIMTKPVSIPLSDVEEVCVQEFSWTWTTVSILLGLLTVTRAVVGPIY